MAAKSLCANSLTSCAGKRCASPFQQVLLRRAGLRPRPSILVFDGNSVRADAVLICRSGLRAHAAGRRPGRPCRKRLVAIPSVFSASEVAQGAGLFLEGSMEGGKRGCAMSMSMSMSMRAGSRTVFPYKFVPLPSGKTPKLVKQDEHESAERDDEEPLRLHRSHREEVVDSGHVHENGG